MRDFIKHMYSMDKDPSGSDDYRSWFLFYKWDVEGEVYFPIHEGELPDLEEGDRLWFAMDYELIGYVDLIRVVEDPLNNRREAWYHGDQCHSMKKYAPVKNTVGKHQTGPVRHSDTIPWLDACE